MGMKPLAAYVDGTRWMVELVLVLPILVGLGGAQQVMGQAAGGEAQEAAEAAAAAQADGNVLPTQDAASGGIISNGASPATRARWAPPAPEAAKQLNDKAQNPPRVRIGLRLTPFKKVVTRNQDGSNDTRYIPAEPIRHTLRARINKTNHFFVGEWHIETRPTKWVKKSRHYEVNLVVYRRYGAFGQLEESMGEVKLAGVLDEQEKNENVHVLLGVARQRLRDKFGAPTLDVVAGFQPAEAPKQGVAQGQAKQDRAARDIPLPPPGYTSEAQRSRF